MLKARVAKRSQLFLQIVRSNLLNIQRLGQRKRGRRKLYYCKMPETVLETAAVYKIALCEPSIFVPEINAANSGIRKVNSAPRMALMRKRRPAAKP